MHPTAIPDRILMATDLGARCDRALARADQLKRLWGAQLTVLHVVEAGDLGWRDRQAIETRAWHRPLPWLQYREAILRADLDGEGIDAASRVLVGHPPSVLAQAILDDAAMLVILGAPPDIAVEPRPFGSTAEHLVRHSRVPVLTVRRRVRAGYRHVAVATDFSEPARHALELAARWFKGARLTLFHASETAGPLLGENIDADQRRREALERACAEHLERTSLAPARIAAISRVIAEGSTGWLLADLVAGSDIDLVVLGSHGRSGLARALLGSTAEHLMQTLDCDTLVVRPPV